MTKTIDSTLKKIRRGGSILHKVFSDCKSKGITSLSGTDALKIMNTYGLDICDIIMIAASHEMTVDHEKLENLLEIEKEEHKNMRPCNV